MAETAEVLILDDYRDDEEEVDPDEFDIELEGASESLDYDEMAENLAPAFAESKEGRDALRQLSDRMIREFDTDWESNEQHREQIAANWKIFTGDLPPKRFPFNKSANAHVPIMLENLSRLQFRATGELFGDWSNVFGVVPVGPNDDEQADILSLHGNWQIREEIPDFQRQQQRGLLMFFMDGDVTCHSFYDGEREQNRHEMLTCDEFVTPFVYVSTMPDYSDLPRYCRIRFYYPHELARQRGRWHDVDRVLNGQQPSWDDEPESLLMLSNAEVNRIEVPDAEDSAPYKIIQYQGMLPLPGQNRDRWCQASIEYSSGAILSLRILEEADWREKDRFERQQQERDAYLFDDAQRDIEVEKNATRRELVDGMQTLLPEERKQLEASIPEDQPAGPMPDWMDEGDLAAEPPELKMRPVHMYSHAVCIEPLTGSLGMGFGHIQADFNRAANTFTSQFTDAATLANSKGIITSALVTWDRPFTMSPGAINVAKGVTGEDLRNNIMPMEYGPANPQLMDMVEKMYEWGQSSIQAPSVLSGEPGKSGETFRGISTRIEQATKQLSVATRKYAEFLTQILKNNARLNAIFLPDEEILEINNFRIGRAQEITIGRALYERGYRIEIRADLKYTSEAQRIADTDQVMQGAMTHPLLMGNLLINWLAIKAAFEARNLQEFIEALGPRPPPQPFGLPNPALMPPQEGGAPGPNGPAGPPPEGGPVQ